MDGFVTLCVTLLVLVVDTGKEVGTILGVNTGRNTALSWVNTGIS